MAAANAQIGVAQAAFYPSARLFAGGGIDISFAGGIALAQFLLDGGLRDARKRKLRPPTTRPSPTTGRPCSEHSATWRTISPRCASSKAKPPCKEPR